MSDPGRLRPFRSSVTFPPGSLLCRAAQAALRESEEKYRKLSERIGEGCRIVEVVFEGRTAVDHRFIDVDPTFERHTGIVNANGRSMREIAPDHELVRHRWRGGVDRPVATVRGRRQSLGDRWYLVNACRVGEPEERLVTIVFSDITQPRLDGAAWRANA